MAKKIDSAFINDIFNIPIDGSNIVDDDSDAYSQTSAPSVSFAEKAKEISKALIPTDIDVKPAEKTVEKTEKEKDIKQQMPKEKVEEKALKSAVSTEQLFGDIVEMPETKPAKVETVAEIPKVEEKQEVPVCNHTLPVQVDPVVKSTNEPQPTVTKQVESVDDGNTANLPPLSKSEPLMVHGKLAKYKWDLNCPAPRYQKFYDAKREALNSSLLKYGELPFDEYCKELEDASVDTSVGETFVPELVCKRMSECQQLRERIKQIQLRVNRQFFQWDRHIELFRGLLARCEYDRGKQEGVEYEHMADLNSYFGELKSLHKSIDNVMRILDSAFECLSRQVTVALPIRDVERHNTVSGQRPMTPALQRFDSLTTHANDSASKGVGQPKEGANAPEPQQGWGQLLK